MKKIATSIDNIASNITKEGAGLPTGFSALDELIRGVNRGELVIIAGRPSIGKSSIMLDIALNMSVKYNVAMFSLEMTEKQVVERSIANKMEKSLSQLKTGDLGVDAAVKKNLSELNLWVNDETSLDVAAMWEILDKTQVDMDVVMIDYLQLMKRNQYSPKHEAIEKICEDLRTLGKKRKCAVILLCQLNRETEKRENHKPRLSDLRDSGGIEQIADKVLLLYRPAYYAIYELGEQKNDDGEAHLIVAKSRDTGTGDIPLVWLPTCMAFRSVTWDLNNEVF